MAKNKKADSTKKMFRDPTGQQDFIEKSYEEELEAKRSQPVECLGKKFPNDDARREYFRGELANKLKDIEFRKVEGFPGGDDQDILDLSDPPYYTACPNPWLQDFLAIWHRDKPQVDEKAYSREPFASDVSEGKSDPVYGVHSYHTKVPHKAVMRYILHYTKPGDVILDGFCGTGMAGVAAALCGDKNQVQQLGLAVGKRGKISDEHGNPMSTLGCRKAILSDLAPAATFVARNYTHLGDLQGFAAEAKRVVQAVEATYGWLYSSDKGRVSTAIWSDVFSCPNCDGEFVFWEAALSKGKLRKDFPCPHCRAVVGKSASKASGATKLNRPFEARFDPVLQKPVQVPKFTLVEEKLRHGKQTHTVACRDIERKAFDARFENRTWPTVPTDKFFAGRQTNKLINGSGIQHVCHMYTPRALFAYAALWEQTLSTPRRTALFRFCLTSINNYISRKQGFFGGGGGVSGTLFTPSIHHERNVFDVLLRKIKKIQGVALDLSDAACVTTQSVADLRNLPSNSIDYVFTDPPFGESLQYSELNMFVEAWLKVKSASKEDCVLNYVHKKDLRFYTGLMESALAEYCRVLKPGRWITIEFHNSQNAVWAAIQNSIETSGLVVADVRVLDKQQKSFNAVNRAGAVDQDLVISAYKPIGALESSFEKVAGSEEGVWEFIRSHLAKLPVFVSQGIEVDPVAERLPHLLFDRMVAFHVQRSVSVPVSASAFYGGLEARFPRRDEMYFLPDQVGEYEKKRARFTEVIQFELFVQDEASAITWLKQQLSRKPQTFRELHPQFMKEIAGWQKHEETLELLDILNQNFLCYSGNGDVPSQIHSYLSTNWKELRGKQKDASDLQAKAKDRWYVPDPQKAQDLEQIRDRALLREFWEYLPEGHKPQARPDFQDELPGLSSASRRIPTGKKMRIIRTEAVRAGFKYCWQNQDYRTIIAVAKRIPEDVLQEDPKLLMWYDQALTRLGEE